MAKETAPPKAVNIVRPSHSFMPQKPASRISTSSSSVASFVSAPPTTYLYQQQHSHSQSNQYQRHPTTSTSKAPRVASTTRVHDTVNHSNKPALNIYHPPSPPQPQPQQQRSKTFSLIDTSHNNNNHRRSIVTSSSSSSSLSNTHHHHHHQPHANHSTAILSPPSPPPQQYTSSSTVSSFSSSMTGSSSSSASHYQQQQSHRPNFEIYKPPSRAKTLAVPPAGLVSQQHSPRRPASHHSTVRNLVVGPISKPHEEPITNVANNNHIIHDESPDELSDQDDESDTIRDSEDDNDQGLENVDDEEEEEEEDEEVNEARVNRKIADLEISNRSLLAVNSMLEATVRKQASEVAKMKSQISGQHPIEPIPPPTILAETTDLSDDEWEKDEQFCRLFRMTEQMIEQGQKALSFEFKAMGRVLSQYNQDDDDDEEAEENDDKIRNKEIKNEIS